MIDELAVEEELAYYAPRNNERLEAKLREVNANKLSVEAKIHRSHLFGRRYSPQSMAINRGRLDLSCVFHGN